jgi:hypothetical protein
MQHVPDERLYRALGRWEDYTNFGILQDFRDSINNIFPLHMDTWCYDNAASFVGHMDLTESENIEELGVEAWLALQVHAFEEAFSDFVHLRTDLVDTNAWGTIIRFDVRATLRGSEGYIGDLWLRNVGGLQIAVRTHDPVHQRAAVSPVVAGIAYLDLDIVSLFLPDNQAALVQTREEWKRLRAEDPTVTIDPREDPPALVAVTLVEPPLSTPLNNQELYTKNGPRLAQAISIWEEITGRPFVWEPQTR